MILTREQFVDWWDQVVPENPANRPDHPLWIPETEIRPGAPSGWFVKASCRRTGQPDYWSWCDANLKGMVRCYMLDEQADAEWWGFTNQEDLLIWMLKWM